MKLACILLPTLAVAFDHDGFLQRRLGLGTDLARLLQVTQCDSESSAVFDCEDANAAACTGDDPTGGAVCFADSKYA
jgi:hypothetical protein